VATNVVAVALKLSCWIKADIKVKKRQVLEFFLN